MGFTVIASRARPRLQYHLKRQSLDGENFQSALINFSEFPFAVNFRVIIFEKINCE